MFLLIFDVPRPSKFVQKSMQKRFQNQLYVGYPVGTLKNTIFDVKTSPRWTTKISDFFQKSLKNASYYDLWSKMPLGSHQEPPKSLPRAVQGPSRGTQEPSRSPHAASKKVSEGWVASYPCHCIWNYSPELECLCQCNLSHSSPMTSVQASPIGSEKLSGGVPSTSSHQSR